MEILRNQEGELCILPDDGFTAFGVPLKEWLFKAPKDPMVDSFDWLSKRLSLAQGAEALVKKEYGLLGLRHEPMVIEHYRIDLKDGSVSPVDYYFVYKYEDNGNTLVAYERDNTPF